MNVEFILNMKHPSGSKHL